MAFRVVFQSLAPILSALDTVEMVDGVSDKADCALISCLKGLAVRAFDGCVVHTFVSFGANFVVDVYPSR